MKSRAVSLSVLVACIFAGACDGDRPPPPPPADSGPRPDAGPSPDAGPIPADAGDAGLEDGAVPPPDGGPLTGGCTFGGLGDTFKLETDIEARGRVVGLAGGPSGWAAVWTTRVDGFPDVHGALVPSSGGTSPLDIASVTDDPWIELQPAIAYDGGQWVVSYVSNATSNYEVYVDRATAALAGSGSASQLTTTTTIREDSTSLVGTSSGYLLSWVEDDGIGRVVYVLGLDTSLAPITTPQVTASGSAGATVPELAAVDSGGAIVLVRGTAAGAEIAIQMLGANGRSIGAPTVVTDTGVEGTVDIAGGTGGGAVVFGLTVGGARSEVRFRGFDGDGALLGGTRVVVGSPEEGRDASITPFAGGYAVAYRRIDSLSEGTIVVSLLDLGGEIVQTLDLLRTSPTGGRTSIQVSGDGHLLVGWAQVGSTQTEIVTARIRCD